VADLAVVPVRVEPEVDVLVWAFIVPVVVVVAAVVPAPPAVPATAPG
jgi:hypothetical protein